MTDPFPQSRCRGCAFLKEVPAARSTFLMCTEPSLPKYPAQPVAWCAAFREREAKRDTPPDIAE